PWGRRGGVLGPLGQLGRQALDGVGHGIAVLLVEDAAEDGDAEGAAELAGGVVDGGGAALLAGRKRGGGGGGGGGGSRAVSLTAEATPCLLGGSEAVMAVVAGVPARAIPAANRTRPVAN